MGLAALGQTKLSVARDCALAFGADVVLLHVSTAPVGGAEIQPREATARAYLDSVVAHLHAAGVQAEAVLRSGPVAATILREAREQNVDLIILGATLRPALLRAFVGSVADAVVRSAPCPVVLVQPARDAGVGSPLQSFTEAAARAGTLTRRPPRYQAVEVNRIIGSLDRVHELGADFRPHRRARRNGDEQRLERIRRAMERGEHVPAIELYQLGFGYYVVDGHHRVAAARLLGQLVLDATVVEFVPRATSSVPVVEQPPSWHDSRGRSGSGRQWRQVASAPDLSRGSASAATRSTMARSVSGVTSTRNSSTPASA
jgi:nucleotide-binding universal stress UspA family protein